MERNSSEAASRYALRAVCLFILTLTLSACQNFLGDCFNTGGAEQVRPSILAIDLSPTTSSPTSPVEYAGYDIPQDFSIVHNFFYHTNPPLFSANRAGSQIFVDSHLFSRNDLLQAPADTLAFCAFTVETDRPYCTEEKPELFFDSSDDGLFPVQIARSSITIWDELGVNPVQLVADSARIISDDQYQITRFIHPVLSRNEQKVAFLRRSETRTVLSVAEEGYDERVDEISYELVLLDRSNNNEMQVLLETVDIFYNDLNKYLSISPDGRYVAINSWRGTSLLIDVNTNTSVPIAPQGQHIFSPSGQYLVSASQSPDGSDHQLHVLDLQTNTVKDSIRITHPYVFSLNRNSDTIHFARGQNLHSYSILQEQETRIFQSTDLSNIRPDFRSSHHDYFHINASTNSMQIVASVWFTFDDPCS